MGYYWALVSDYSRGTAGAYDMSLLDFYWGMLQDIF